MLMRLVLDGCLFIVTGIVNLLPSPPALPTVEVPWPQWISFAAFAGPITTLLVGFAAVTVLRLARWIYGMIPLAG